MLLGGLALLLATSLPAQAGKNAGGALIVHTNDANTYTGGVCARFDTMDSPGTCELAGTQTNNDDATPSLIWIIAAFDPGESPGVSSIYFGLNHNLPPDQGYFANFAVCGPAGTLELPDAGWPETGGNTVAYPTPIVDDTFFPVYVLNAYGFADAFLGSGINPTGGYAAFIDDGNPPLEDNITRFGVVNWGEAGSNECPEPAPTGACCLQANATCIVTNESECQLPVGLYLGDGSVCGEPCGPCCYWDEFAGQPSRYCVVTTENDCVTGPSNATTPNWSLLVPCLGYEVDSEFGTPGIICGDGTNFETQWWCMNPLVDCDIATQPTSWGQIKTLYRR
jgi:hypothetical protein